MVQLMDGRSAHPKVDLLDYQLVATLESLTAVAKADPMVQMLGYAMDDPWADQKAQTKVVHLAYPKAGSSVSYSVSSLAGYLVVLMVARLAVHLVAPMADWSVA